MKTNLYEVRVFRFDGDTPRIFWSEMFEVTTASSSDRIGVEKMHDWFNTQPKPFPHTWYYEIAKITRLNKSRIFIAPKTPEGQELEVEL